MPVGKRGGSSPGERRGGRKPGVVTKNVRIKQLAALEGIRFAKSTKRTPLEFLLGVQNGAEWLQTIPLDELPQRFQAAIAAAPYCHARLAAVAVQQVPDTGAERRRDMLKQLPYQQRKQIEAILAAGLATAEAPDDGTEGDAPQIEGVAVDNGEEPT